MGKNKNDERDFAHEDGYMMGDSVIDTDDDEQSIEEQAAQVSQAANDEDTHRVEILVAINGHQAHDKVTVAKSHAFYSGLLDQNLAQVID